MLINKEYDQIPDTDGIGSSSSIASSSSQDSSASAVESGGTPPDITNSLSSFLCKIYQKSIESRKLKDSTVDISMRLANINKNTSIGW